jgi:hypothetical protein
MLRRDFLRCSVGTIAGTGPLLAADMVTAVQSPRVAAPGSGELPLKDCFVPRGPIRSVIPVVGDGKWVWTSPPKDQTGYLEPRKFDVEIGIELTGRGNGHQILATTPVPVQLPEQKIDHHEVKTQGCLAKLRGLAPEAGQLMLAAPSIVKGQSVWAKAHFSMTLFKQYQGFEKDRFPAEQKLPRTFRNPYRADSPGIQTRSREVRDLAVEVTQQLDHPWDQAKAFYNWVWTSIRPRVGEYTSVLAAVKDRVGDCEECAAVFVAMCRAVGIPARLVWIPNHNWAEFYLLDHQGEGHWIPAHTAAYSWFGWTGAHELVIQKGDNIRVPEKHKSYRLLEDWMQWQGAKPGVRYTAEITPVASNEGDDPGPGARTKSETGEWKVVNKHSLDATLRDGPSAAARMPRIRRRPAGRS